MQIPSVRQVCYNKKESGCNEGNDRKGGDVMIKLLIVEDELITRRGADAAHPLEKDRRGYGGNGGKRG